MWPHPLTNFKIQRYYQNEPRLIQFILEIICLKNIKDGPYVINLDEYTDFGTHWIALYCKNIETVYFDSFEVEHVPKKSYWG